MSHTAEGEFHDCPICGDHVDLADPETVTAEEIVRTQAGWTPTEDIGGRALGSIRCAGSAEPTRAAGDGSRSEF